MRGVYPEIDELSKSLEDVFEHIQCITTRISGIIDIPTSCKLDYTDKRGWYIYCTKVRHNTLKQRLTNIMDRNLNVRNANNDIIYEIPCDSFMYSVKDGSNMFIEFPIIKELTTTLVDVNQRLKEKNITYWNETMDRLYTTYSPQLKRLHLCIADIDVSSNNAKISVEHGYHRPTLQSSDKSFVKAQGLRHPIVERISTAIEYVSNDIHIGCDDQDGILLFGTNACGKSTLMKALGLSVIMAQAGLYVPSSSFIFKPYTKLFTRILNNDNIFRSQSSFAVEIQELQSIFTAMDDQSLILADELCSGTETNSAISIVTASIEEFSTTKNSFMITSHLHQLTELEEIQTIPNLRIYHLKIDIEGDTLIYDRRLTDGPGPPIYGLKVCEVMGLPKEFISRAKFIQNKLLHVTNQLVSTKSSQYNKDVFMDQCKVCGEKTNLETHHIEEQYLADDHNMIGDHSKNIKHNLVQLCKGCHDNVTYGKLVIHGYKDTSKGPKLIYEYIDYEKTKKKKLSIQQVAIIQKYRGLLETKQITKTTCVQLLDTKHDIHISSGTLSKVMNGTY